MERTQTAIADTYTLALNQERIWFLQNLDDEGLPLAHVARMRLKDSLQKVVEKHGILHTDFLAFESYPCSQTTPVDIGECSPQLTIAWVCRMHHSIEWLYPRNNLRGFSRLFYNLLNVIEAPA